MSMQTFAPCMFAGLVVILLLGFPVAFSLAALGVGCGAIAITNGWFPAQFMSAIPLNVFGILSNELLLAIPFFTLMGSILEKCGLVNCVEGLDTFFYGNAFNPSTIGSLRRITSESSKSVWAAPTPSMQVASSAAAAYCRSDIPRVPETLLRSCA